MAQTIKIKQSSEIGKIPATTDLSLGELGVNTHDGKLFLKKNNGVESIVEVGLNRHSYASCTNGIAQTFSNIQMVIAFDNASTQSPIFMDLANNKFILAKTGRYRVAYKINLKGETSSRENPLVFIRLNGVKVLKSVSHSYNRNIADGRSSLYFSMVDTFTQNDEIQFVAEGLTNNNITIIAYECYFEIEFLNEG